MRKSKNNGQPKITEEYLEKLKIRDFWGKLTDEEVKIARKYGLIEFHFWHKRGRKGGLGDVV